MQAAGLVVLGVVTLHPAIAGAAAGLALHWLAVTGHLPSFLDNIWREGGAWAATFCFMLQPAVHLVCSARGTLSMLKAYSQHFAEITSMLAIQAVLPRNAVILQFSLSQGLAIAQSS